MRASIRFGVLSLLSFSLLRCGSDDSTATSTADSGTSDSGVSDSAAFDSGSTDSEAPVDSGSTDASADAGVDAGPFTPASLASVSLWLDGDTTTVTASAVTTWPDQSSHHNDATQATAANQPTLTAAASGINNHAVVTFDGATSSLSIADSASLQLGSSGFLIEAVVRFPAATTGDLGQSIYDKAASGTGVGPQLDIVHTSAAGHGAEFLAQVDATDSVNSDFTIAVATAHRVTLQWSSDDDGGTGGTLSLAIDATAAITKHLAALPDLSASGTAVAIGRSTAGSALAQFFKGDIATIVVVNGPIASGDRTKLDGYLETRFGL
jgi:hypothetical protein